MMNRSKDFQEEFVLIIVLLAVSIKVDGQGTIDGTPNGIPYFCVPPGICLGGIDPRILTPDVPDMAVDQELQKLVDEVFYNKILTDGTPTPGIVSCPAGKIPCFAQGSDSSCGQRGPNKGETDGLADLDAYPWLAYLVGPSGYLGVGSLLSPYHVLTAAHKVLSFESMPAQLTVYFGVSNPANLGNPPKPNSTAEKIFIHPNHNNKTLKNDIAVVRLLNPVSLLDPNKVNTICLPLGTDTNTTFTTKPQNCLVSGWGQIQPNNTAVPTQLKQVNVKTTDIDTCEEGFSGKLDTSVYLDKVGEICAGGEAQKDACFQDGGAPLNCKKENASVFTVAGIVIWGKSCGQPGVYGVYTNVPTYRSWVVSTIIQPIP